MSITARLLFASPVFTIALTPEEQKIFSAWDDIEQLHHFIPNISDFTASSGEASNTKYVLEKYPEQKEKLLSLFYELNNKLLHYNTEFKITTSWFTKTGPKKSSQLHNHRNSFYSGVFYFGDYDPGSSPLKFVDMSPKANFFLIPEKQNSYNSEQSLVFPEKGNLIFFPSYLHHKIETNTSNSPRYSLAFNIIPTGKFGHGDSTISIDLLDTIEDTEV